MYYLTQFDCYETFKGKVWELFVYVIAKFIAPIFQRIQKWILILHFNFQNEKCYQMVELFITLRLILSIKFLNNE